MEQLQVENTNEPYCLSIPNYWITWTIPITTNPPSVFAIKETLDQTLYSNNGWNVEQRRERRGWKKNLISINLKWIKDMFHPPFLFPSERSADFQIPRCWKKKNSWAHMTQREGGKKQKWGLKGEENTALSLISFHRQLATRPFKESRAQK